MTRITRVEVITNNGREYVSWEDDNDIVTSIQDNGRTLKVFVNKVKPKTGEEGALEALEKFQNDWLLGKKCPETKLEIKKLDSVESIKAEIKMLQSKLEFYEELEKQPKTLFDVIRNLGYSVDMCYEIVDAVDEFEKSKEPEEDEWKSVALRFGEKLSAIGPCGYYDFTPVEWYDWVVDIYENTANEYLKLLEKERARAKAQEHEKEQKWDVVRESVKWCEEHPNESVEDYLKPQTPEQTSQSLKEAFVKAQQTENWKETQKLIDEEDNDKNFKNSLDLIKEWGEKNKPPTLYQLIEDWWSDIFCANSMDDMETCIDGLVDKIDKQFIPPPHNTNDYQWNKCLKMMRDKLR